jgi:hypothetical protein
MKAIVAIAALCCAAGVPQDKPEFPKPGKEHALLKSLTGEWIVSGKFFMDPSQPPMEIKGMETGKMELGGFWLLSEFKSEMFGAPFEGRSTMGYSPAKKKYVGTWVDSMVPHLFVTEGEADAAGKVITMVGDGLDPATGKSSKERWVIEVKSDELHTMTFYNNGSDGKERKTGELTYTRKK